MAPGYAWICKFCEGRNDAGSEVCAACGRSARARPIEVEQARGERGVPTLRQVAQLHKNALRTLFWIVAVSSAGFLLLDHFWLRTGDVWVWPMLYFSLPWSIAMFLLPVLGLVAIPVGLGINAVILAIAFLWFMGMFR